MELGAWTNDPRIIRTEGYGVAVAGGGYLLDVRGRFMVRIGEQRTEHDDLETALRQLLGEPRSLLVHALAGEFDADHLRGMAAAIAEEGWSDVGTAFEVLQSALVEAARVS